MTLLWMKQQGATRYEVRTAGRSVRLYTNGIFHSQHNSGNPVSGSVWDLLLLPAFLHPAAAPRRVLVLGVGGGAVIRQLNYFIQPQQILGIDLDPVHLHVARKFFGNNEPNVELLEADAIDWVGGYRGPRFDMVIDDIFGEVAGEPVKAIDPDAAWFASLLRLLTPKGVLVSNFVSPEALRGCGYFTSDKIRSRFASAFLLTTPLYENAVGAFSRSACDRGKFNERIGRHPELDQRRASCRLRYKMESL